MDKQTLTLSQLKELKHFIRSRGFREPEIQMEILDHFACKVEEKMAAKPTLALEDAMREAHREFGYSGFHKIRQALDDYTVSRYKRIYWAEVRRLVLSIPYVLLLLLLGYGVYAAFLWAGTNNISGFFHHNLVGSIACMLILALMIARLIWIRRKKNYYHIQRAMRAGYISFTVICLSLPRGTGSSGHRLSAEAVVIAILMILFIIDYLASFKTLVAAQKDHDEFETLHQQQSLTS